MPIVGCLRKSSESLVNDNRKSVAVDYPFERDRIQFRCWPLHAVVHDSCQAEALAHKVQVLPRKGSKVLVDAQVHLKGLFSIYFLTAKKDGGF